MNVWINIVMAVQIITALAMAVLILMQHGKGADMGASFGGGASGSLFGATGGANFLSRTTAILAAAFFISTLTLAALGKGNVESGNSVLSTQTVSPATNSAPAGTAPAAPTIPAQ